jgi:tRNA-dihydrouridine synthase C
MIGRGAVIRPDFIRRLRGENIEFSWAELLEWQLVFLDGMRNIEANPYHIDGKSVLKWTEQGVVGRYKQWLAMLTQGWPEAKLLFERIKKERQCEEIRRVILSE